VDGRPQGEVKRLYADADEPGRVRGGDRISLLLECPVCYSALVVQQQLTNYEEEIVEQPTETWSEAKRIYPSPQSSFDNSIPQKIRDSLEEAQGCLHFGRYTASVAMTGRSPQISN
jgi:hypothetical protein